MLILKLRGMDTATKGRKIGRKGPEGGGIQSVCLWKDVADLAV